MSARDRGADDPAVDEALDQADDEVGFGWEVVVPSGLVVPDAARRRLRRVAILAEDDVVAIAAPVVSLIPGTSTTVLAEWAALAPVELAEHDSGPDDIRAGVLVRAGVDVEVTDDGVRVGRGRVLLDAGAISVRVDPAAADSDAVEPAAGESVGTHGRPPFRVRPVVAFVATGPVAAAVAEPVAALIDGLIDLGVEARLAAPATPAAPRLTRRCGPDRESLRALAPDVVVALDPSAGADVDDWCTARSTTIVELDADLGPEVALVPWIIGRARGRVRARVGPAVAAAALAALVNRLCSGPPPGPPIDAELDLSRGPDEPGRRVVALPTRRPGAPAARPGVVTLGPGDMAVAAWRDGLGAAGCPVTDADTDERDAAQRDDERATIALVSAGANPDVVARWRTGAADRHAVLVVAPGADVVGADDALVAAVDRAVVTEHDTAARLRARGVRVHVAPLLLPAARVTTLVRAAALRLTPAEPIVANWSAPDDVGAELAARAPTIEVVTDHPDPGQLAGWTAAMWQPTTAPADRGRPPQRLVDAALAGVPVVMTRAAARGAGGIADPQLVIDDDASPARWAEVVTALVDDDWRATCSQRAQAAAAALVAADGRDGAVRRFLGWLGAEAAR